MVAGGAAIKAGFGHLFDKALSAGIIGFFNDIINEVEEGLNGFINKLNNLPGVNIDLINIPRIGAKAENDARGLGRVVRDAFNESFRDHGQGVENFVDNVLLDAAEVSKKRRLEEEAKRKEEELKLQALSNIITPIAIETNPFERLADQYSAAAQDILSETKTLGKELDDLLGPDGTLVTGFSDAAAGAILFGDNFRESFGNVAKQAATSLVSALIQVGIQTLIAATIGKTAAVSQAATQVTANATIAASAAPAAALTSLASFGVNSIPAIAGILATVAAVSFFKDGGTFANGIATGPTAFQFGGGKLGVMGEAGPEAVMPLSRDSRGRLGVQASGGGGKIIQVSQEFNINVNPTGDSDADRAAAEQVAALVRQQTLEVLRQEQRNGGLLNKQDTF